MHPLEKTTLDSLDPKFTPIQKEMNYLNCNFKKIIGRVRMVVAIEIFMKHSHEIKYCSFNFITVDKFFGCEISEYW